MLFIEHGFACWCCCWSKNWNLFNPVLMHFTARPMPSCDRSLNEALLQRIHLWRFVADLCLDSNCYSIKTSLLSLLIQIHKCTSERHATCALNELRGTSTSDDAHTSRICGVSLPGIMKAKWTVIISFRRFIYCTRISTSSLEGSAPSGDGVAVIVIVVTEYTVNFPRYLLKWSLPAAYCYYWHYELDWECERRR